MFAFRALAWAAGVAMIGIPAFADELSRLEKVGLTRTDETVLVHLTGTRAPVFTSFTLQDPFRVVVDWSGSRLGDVPATQDFRSRLVKGVELTQFGSESEHISRIVIRLAHEATYQVQADETTVTVRFDVPPGEGTTESEDDAPVVEPEPQPAAAGEEAGESGSAEDEPALAIEGPLTEPDLPVPEAPPPAPSVASMIPDTPEPAPEAPAAPPPSTPVIAASKAAPSPKPEAKPMAKGPSAHPGAPRVAVAIKKPPAQKIEPARAPRSGNPDEGLRPAAPKVAKVTKGRVEPSKPAPVPAKRSPKIAVAKSPERATPVATPPRAQKAQEDATRTKPEPTRTPQKVAVPPAKPKSEPAARVAANRVAAKAPPPPVVDPAPEARPVAAAVVPPPKRKPSTPPVLPKRSTPPISAEAPAKPNKAPSPEKKPGPSEPVRLASFSPTVDASRPAPTLTKAPSGPSSWQPPAVGSSSPSRRPALAQAAVEPDEVAPDEEAEPAREVEQDYDPGPREMKYIGFRQMADISRIFVRMDGKARYRTIRRGSNVVLELVNTSVPIRNNRRPLDTSYFNSPVMKVQAVPSGGNTRIEVRLRERVPFQVKRIGTTIAIDFTRAG